MKKLISVIISAIFLMSVLSGCANSAGEMLSSVVSMADDMLGGNDSKNDQSNGNSSMNLSSNMMSSNQNSANGQ